MYASNVERAGGARDESEVYVDYSREELSAMLRRIENRCRQLAENDEKTTRKRRECLNCEARTKREKIA